MSDDAIATSANTSNTQMECTEILNSNSASIMDHQITLACTEIKRL